MFKIAKEFSFDMAHLIDGHDGKCQNLHGHTYKLQVEVAGDLFAEGAKAAMVMDLISDVSSRVCLTPKSCAIQRAFSSSIEWRWPY